MKRLIPLLAVALSLLATGCRLRHDTDLYNRFYHDGISPDEVRAEMRQGGYDYALLINESKRQTATYGWTDSLHFFTRIYESDGDTSQQDFATELPRTDLCIERTPQGNWSIRFNSIPDWMLKIRMDSVHVTTAGVEFRVRLHRLPFATAVFVSDRPELCSTELFDLSEVQQLMFHAVIDLLLDADMDADFDELTVFGDENDSKPTEKTQAS